MAEKSKKVSPKSFIRKSKITDNSTKSRSFSKSGSTGNKIKTARHEMPHDSKVSVGVLGSDAAPKTYLGKCFEDQQLKLKLLELTPRNPAMETSEGIQEFIKQVSNFIEKKNPFKGKVVHSFGRIERNVVPVDSVKFNTTNENLQNNQKFHLLKASKETFDENNEINSEETKKYLEKLKWEKPNSLVSLKRQSERVPQGKKNRSGVSVNNKKIQKELQSKNKKNAEFKRVITLNENPLFLYENERLNHATHVNEKKNSDTSTNKQNQAKKKKLSEIPLRRSRKLVSTLLQKPLENVESTFSIDLYPTKKPFSPIEELSLCSEIQVIISAVGSSEKLSESGKASDCEPDKKKNSEESSFGKIKLNRCFKTPDITSDSNSSSAKLFDDLSFTDKKVKVLDLEKVKTASFTVLRSSTDVFNRLESLHKRNISTKEEIIASKTVSKLRILCPKNSFSSVKEKVSKKNLSCRLSSKANKPSPKIKKEKNKEEAEETFALLKKCSLTKNKTNLDICNDILAAGNLCLVSRTYEFDNSKNENFKANQNKERTDRESDSNIPITIKKLSGKSISRRIGIQKEKLKTCSNPPSASSKANNENFPKSEKPEPIRRNSFCGKKSEKASHRNENPDEKKNELILGFKCTKTMPRTPPPTPNICHSTSELSAFEDCQIKDQENSSNNIILDNKFHEKNKPSWCNSETEARKKPTKTKSNIRKVESESKETVEITKIKKLGLVIKGMPLNFKKDEPPEKPESSDSSKIKTQLKIDLSSQNKAKTPEENIKNLGTFDWLFMSNKKCNEELVRPRTDRNNLSNEEIKERKIEHNFEITKSIASELTEEKVRNKTFDSGFRKPRKCCCSSFKRRTQYKTSSISLKRVRKKKVRSDTEDRRLSSSAFFNSDLSLQNQVKADSKLKDDLKKENQKDLFKDVALVKLRRRNSEPHSFKEFVWKPTDFGNYKGVRPSMSSLSSSLKHLNTDDIDDFIFWEPIPQKMTSYWETSLYHFKKPWTVLSCSVFKDNRQSKTPGSILENLRNGGIFNISQSAKSQNERGKCHKENPFDVEPSIAQKNIDIRNWLAALNFPTLPSTSNDVIKGEGHFSVQSTNDAHDVNKTEMCQKRRKVLPNIKFSDETSEKEVEGEEKYKTSTDWEMDEKGHLMELIRRESGGYVTKGQFLNSDQSVPCPNVTVSFNVNPKLIEKKVDEINSRKAITPRLKMLESLEAPSRSGVSLSETIIDTNSVRRNQSVGTDEIKYELSEAVEKKKKFGGKRRFRLKLKPLISETKVWKFLFMFTLFVAVVHYSFLSSSGRT